VLSLAGMQVEGRWLLGALVGATGTAGGVVYYLADQAIKGTLK
jgi:hypothetical protein